MGWGRDRGNATYSYILRGSRQTTNPTLPENFNYQRSVLRELDMGACLDIVLQFLFYWFVNLMWSSVIIIRFVLTLSPLWCSPRWTGVNNLWLHHMTFLVCCPLWLVATLISAFTLIRVHVFRYEASYHSDLEWSATIYCSISTFEQKYLS